MSSGPEPCPPPHLPPTAGRLSVTNCVSKALSPRCHVLLLPCHSVLLPVHLQQRLLYQNQSSSSNIQLLYCFYRFIILGSKHKHRQSSPLILFQDGMGKLQLNQDGLHLEGVSEFQMPLYVNEIQSRRVSSSKFPADQCFDTDGVQMGTAEQNIWEKVFGEKDFSKAVDQDQSFSVWEIFDQFIKQERPTSLWAKTWQGFEVLFVPRLERLLFFFLFVAPSSLQ